ncbi:FLYWCH zinc finger domain [Popillia japonica]|uniref:FLYWCH zinc finger domain n=1 Tax=Popillia japonica TaxID=7064 RepID=A0AAW1MMD8_POPJA
MTGDCGERGGYSEGSIDSWGTLRNTNMTPGERRGTVRNAGELWGILWWHREALETDGGLRGTRGYSEGSIGTWGSLKNTSMIVGEGRGTVRKAGELWHDSREATGDGEESCRAMGYPGGMTRKAGGHLGKCWEDMGESGGTFGNGGGRRKPEGFRGTVGQLLGKRSLICSCPYLFVLSLIRSIHSSIVTYVINKRGNRCLIFGKHMFSVNRVFKDSVFWKCNEYSKTACKCRVTTTTDGVIKCSTVPHNHPHNIEKLKKHMNEVDVYYKERCRVMYLKFWQQNKC